MKYLALTLLLATPCFAQYQSTTTTSSTSNINSTTYGRPMIIQGGTVTYGTPNNVNLNTVRFNNINMNSTAFSRRFR